MKDNYDFSAMRRVAHPLAGKVKLVSKLGCLSDIEFERKLLGMEPDERDIARMLRQRAQQSDLPAQPGTGAAAM
jgi:hypothetical protein